MLEFIRNFYFPENVLNFLKAPISPALKVIDYWMLIHFGAGIALGYILGKRMLLIPLFLLIFYELFEVYLFSQGLIAGETFANIVLDIIVGFFGYLIGARIRENQ